MRTIKTNLLLFTIVTIWLESAAQFETFSESFNILTTVAGTGKIEDKGVNGWQSGFENQLAIQTELSRPHIAMADSIGNIYIADKDAHAIRKVDANGIITTFAGTSVSGDNGDGKANEHQLSSPNGLWAMKDGSLYILDLGNSKIRYVDASGNMATVFKDDNGMGLGRGLCISENEDTIWYSSTNKIKQWTKNNGIEVLADGFLNLGNIVQAPNGNIYATDRSANLVYCVERSGTKTVIAGNGGTYSNEGLPALETSFYGVRGIWVLQDGSYFLATHEGSQVWYVDVLGIAHIFLHGCKGDEYHSGDGENYKTPGCKISEARAVTVDHRGNVIITENDVGYVRKVARKDVQSRIASFEPTKNPLLAYPNPISSQLIVEFSLATDECVELNIENQQGIIISQLIKSTCSKGINTIQWNRENAPQGIYFLTMNINGKIFSRKLILTD